ncbi:phenylhydantoinase [compost metagenome]
MLHDAVGYTPYEGRELQGWPVEVYSRGRCVVKDNTLHVERGSGQFIARLRPDPVVKRAAPSEARKVFGEFIGLKSAALSK